MECALLAGETLADDLRSFIEHQILARGRVIGALELRQHYKGKEIMVGCANKDACSMDISLKQAF